MIDNTTPEPTPHPLRSVHTTNFPGILESLGISLVVSTYQAGKLIVLRSDQGVLNTHFRVFQKPMGLAADRSRIAVGTANQILELRNVPAVTQRLKPPEKHDACYLPRKSHVTGDIDIHEMAWANQELWFINTRFSCLCTLDSDHSFVPRWRPKFVTALTPEDRCHLNGLAMEGDRPKYVTALGNTDTQGGWRENKAKGGVLIEIDSHEQICTGLSMPHSPRIYQDRLLVLESGNGSLASVDLNNGNLTPISLLPGFTRGIDFCGSLAFIGLSQVRETAVFSGIPITERLAERTCGIWVVDINTGQTVAFVKFEEGVQEIFAVQILQGIRFPEVIDYDKDLIAYSYVLPDEALGDVPPERKQVTLGDSWQKLLHQGITAREEEKWSEAIALLTQVVQLNPRCPEAYNNLGISYQKQNQLTSAIAAFEQAITLQPEWADAHYNLGMALLKAGDWPRGWAECEWRWQTANFHPLVCPQPLWDGTPLPHGTILIHTEQGAGDSIQFIRYLPLVRSRCRKLILFCTPDLLPLFSTLEAVDLCLTPGNIPLEEFQAYLPLMSLPHIFGTTIDSIPNQIPYLKPPNPSPVVLKSLPHKPFKVGLVWSGSHTYSDNHNRSCHLLDFAPLLAISGVSFFSLQKGPQTAELSQVNPPNLIDLSGHLVDFGATAAAISQLDLLITVDTAVAHLAGALAKPAWVLLCFAADWRWLLQRYDSPWYRNLTLIRQPSAGDWSSVIRLVEEELRHLVKSSQY